MANILLAVTGSIASYKSADLVNSLKKTRPSSYCFNDPGCYRVYSTFDTTGTLSESCPLRCHEGTLSCSSQSYRTWKKADVFIVAPATANTIAKLAHGFADNMVTSTALALPSHIPKLIAPAMNTKMYDHPATQANLKTLESYGYQLIAPKESLLACGDHGRGALADLTIILERIKETIDEKTL